MLLIQYEPPDPFSSQINLPIPADYQVTIQGLQYGFDNSDLSEFKNTFKGLELLNQTSETKICISRFNKSYSPRKTNLRVLIYLVKY